MTRKVGFDEDETGKARAGKGPGLQLLLVALGCLLAGGGVWTLMSGRILAAVALIVAGVAIFTTGASALIRRAAGLKR
ncbi:hypothetical protein HMH01_12305 [Halovulum dunhuangense]|uniref:Uncharacterized protein n=1 Tax=Halovulum dunhuangense TaxID=1505036 RepID=A0A849L4F6_9RHOB|nr:hypothetical protein [Halovulum dunhuangense]NNU81219.1 hypothetical protein [Halovulum dunhuangense]